MTIEDLVEAHARLHNSRMTHIDELIDQANTKIQSHPDKTLLEQELSELRRQREHLLAHIEALDSETNSQWHKTSLEKSGPMVMWETVASKLEKLIERIS